MGTNSLAKLPKSFTRADLLEFIEATARAAAKETADAIEKANRKHAKQTDPGKAAQRLLADYRRLKIAQREDIQITEAEGLELRWRYLEDLMGTPDHAMVTEERAYARERKLQYNQYKIQQIETAVDLYRRECENSGNEEALRRFRVVRMRYIDETELSAEEIAEREGISVRSVYSDVSIASRIIAVYLAAI